MAGESIKTAAQMVRSFIGLDLTNRFTLRRSYDIVACREIVANKRRNSLIGAQKLKIAEHAELGSDLAVARFVLDLSGRIQCGDKKWITERKKLPRDFSESFKLTAIELTKTNLVTEGIDNFVGLEHLESLNLSGSFLLDDFACDQLSRQFRNSQTLQNIDISHISFITVYGLEILLRIPSLQKISAIGTQASKFENIDLFALAAQDECNCKVLVHDDGRQFISKELEEVYSETIPRLEAPKRPQITSGHTFEVI